MGTSHERPRVESREFQDAVQHEEVARDPPQESPTEAVPHPVPMDLPLPSALQEEPLHGARRQP